MWQSSDAPALEERVVRFYPRVPPGPLRVEGNGKYPPRPIGYADRGSLARERVGNFISGRKGPFFAGYSAMWRTSNSFGERVLWNFAAWAQSGLMLAARITLAHFSVYSAMNVPKSAGELANTVPLRSASRALILGSARPALISLLSLSMISAGVFLGAPTPCQPVPS